MSKTQALETDQICFDLKVALVLTLILTFLVLFISHNVPLAIYDYSLEQAFYIGTLIGALPSAMTVVLIYLWLDIFTRIKGLREIEERETKEREKENENGEGDANGG